MLASWQYFKMFQIRGIVRKNNCFAFRDILKSQKESTK